MTLNGVMTADARYLCGSWVSCHQCQDIRVLCSSWVNSRMANSAGEM